MSKRYQRRDSYQYHEDTVDMSDHAWERHAQRLSQFSPQTQAIIKARAIEAAAKSPDHTGVKLLKDASGDVWVVVAGRTVKTIIVTPHGQHLEETSPCNRYYIRPEAR